MSSPYWHDHMNDYYQFRKDLYFCDIIIGRSRKFRLRETYDSLCFDFWVGAQLFLVCDISFLREGQTR